MPGILRCVKCNHIDHMDIRYPHGGDMDVNLHPVPLICAICAGLPWHNRLTRQVYNPEYHDVVNPPTSNPTT
jgi:hypothetical protein